MRTTHCLLLVLFHSVAAAQAEADNTNADLVRRDGWRAVGAGSQCTAGRAGVQVRYERQMAAAFGLALSVRPGELRDVERLRVKLVGDAGATLLVSMRADDGAIHSWPTAALGDQALELDLDVLDLTWDGFQNRDREQRAFDPKRVVAISIVDIAGYFGGAPGARKFTLSSLTRGSEEAVDVPAAIGPGETAMFAALVGGTGDVDTAIAALRMQILQAPREPRPQLLLGLAHLWRASGSRRDPKAIDDLLLADVWFDRVAALDPSETRLPSWQGPVRLALGKLLGQPERGAEAVRSMVAATRADVGFHGFALGLIGWSTPPESEPFQRGLAAVRKTIEDRDPNDPSVRNEWWWPHNREGFLLFAADYEHRAGEQKRAEDLLQRLTAYPDFESWPYRKLVAERRASWRDPEFEPPAGAWMQGQSCAVCHRAR